jgi:hypothetical protein
MTVAELVEKLKAMPQGAPVALVVGPDSADADSVELGYGKVVIGG